MRLVRVGRLPLLAGIVRFGLGAVAGPGVDEIGALVALGLAQAREPDSCAANVVLTQQDSESHSS